MFENPAFFWFFLGLPLIIILFVFDIILLKKRAKNIAGKNIQTILPYYSEGQKWIRLVLYTLGFCFVILALARPKWGVHTINSEIKGRDILILLDSSYSMSTNDIIPSRFDIAKKSISKLLEQETGDRIGLMIFSGESELISPITHDYAAVNFFLDSLYPGILGKDGTNIGKALLEAIDSFEDEGINNKMILLITDGENLQGDLKNILKKVKQFQIKVFTIGVGTKNGEPIPIKNTKGEVTSYVKDQNGEPVISKINEEYLKMIAAETNGRYLGRIHTTDILKYAIDNIKNIEKKEQKSLTYEQKTERYDIFLIPALFLFCFGFILDQGRIFKSKTNKFDWLIAPFKSNNKNTILIIFILLNLVCNQNIYSQNKNSSNIQQLKEKKAWIKRPNGGFWGNIYFNKKKYEKALDHYISAIECLKDNELSKLNYNIANVFYKINDFKKASQFYENAIGIAKDDKLKSTIYYNHGLTEFKNQNYSLARELFKKSLKYNTSDDDARYNYTICDILKKEGEKYSEDKNNPQNNNDDKESNKDKNSNAQNNQQDQKQNADNQNNQQEMQLSKDDIKNLLKALDEKEAKENRDRNQENRKTNTGRGKYW